MIARLFAFIAGILLLIITLQWIRQDDDAVLVVREGYQQLAELIRKGAEEVKSILQ